MANNKLLVDIDGKVKIIDDSYINTDANSLVVNKLSASQVSLNVENGILASEDDKLTSISAVDSGKIIVSDGNKWVAVQPSSGQTISGNPQDGDLDGNYPNPIVKNLSHVQSGVLPIERGGTGLSSYPASGETLIVGNGSGTPSLINALSGVNGQALLFDGEKWTFTNQGSEGDKSINVQIFNTPGTYTWTKPANTKMIRVLAQGGGGGGGSGANRDNNFIAYGGGGGSAGGFVDITSIIDGYITSGTVIVGAGGSGAISPLPNSSGSAGGAGQSSSLLIENVTYAQAYGGNGGSGGTIMSPILPSGGTSVSGFSEVYDTAFDERKIISSPAGSSASTTSGISQGALLSSSFGKALSGGSGGSLSADYLTKYNGGSGLSAGGIFSTNNGTTSSINASPAVSASIDSYISIYNASGGGGGASSGFNGHLRLVDDSSDVNLSTANCIIDFELRNSTTDTYEDSNNNRAVSIVGGAYLESSNYKTGRTSLYCNGSSTTTGAYVARTPFGAGNFTIEAWIFPTSIGSDLKVIFDFRQSGSTFGGFSVFIATTGKLVFGYNSGGSPQYTSSATISVGYWIHIAYVRNNGTLSLYINGVLDSTFSDSINDTSVNCWIGYPGRAVVQSRDYIGFIDRVRIHNSAIYTSNFTPKSTLYKSSTTIGNNIGGIGSDGVYGSGGGGGGASSNYTAEQVKQGGNGGDGYVAIISYK